MKKRVLLLTVLLLLMLSLSSCGVIAGAVFGETFRKMSSTATVQFVDGDEVLHSATESALFVSMPADPEKAGYTFSGWYFNETFTVPCTLDALQQKISEGKKKITVHAQFSPITYLHRHAEIEGASVNITFGKDFTIPIPVTPAGEVFYGWATEYNGETVMLTDRQGKSLAPWSIPASCLLYPTWTPVSVTVRLDAGEGRLDTATVTCCYGKGYGALPIPTREGYNFNGWYTKDGEKVLPSTLCEPKTESVTLYARWLGAARTIFFDYGGGTGTVTQKRLRLGEDYGTLPTATREGYTFLGWGVSSDDLFDQGSPTKLTAEWQPLSVLVIFDYNGGTNDQGYSQKNIVYTYGQVLTESLSPQRYGYLFDGWYTQKEGGTRVAVERGTFLKNTRLYARWLPTFIDAANGLVEGMMLSDAKPLVYPAYDYANDRVCYYGDGTLYIASLRDEQVLHKISTPRLEQLVAESGKLAVLTWDDEVHIYSTVTGKLLSKPDINGEKPRSIGLALGSLFLLNSTSVCAIPLEEGAPEWMLGHPEATCKMLIDKKLGRLYLWIDGSSFPTVTVYSLSTGEELLKKRSIHFDESIGFIRLADDRIYFGNTLVDTKTLEYCGNGTDGFEPWGEYDNDIFLYPYVIFETKKYAVIYDKKTIYVYNRSAKRCVAKLEGIELERSSNISPSPFYDRFTYEDEKLFISSYVGCLLIDLS